MATYVNLFDVVIKAVAWAVPVASFVLAASVVIYLIKVVFSND